uniref:Uncharacterized protein n=1 Tax=Magallana gigas TaxID=29159 RepID=A0A8W8L597_MAGGI
MCRILFPVYRWPALIRYLTHDLSEGCVSVCWSVSPSPGSRRTNVSELFHYIQAITSFLAPPVCAVYVLAVFWKRTKNREVLRSDDRARGGADPVYLGVRVQRAGVRRVGDTGRTSSRRSTTFTSALFCSPSSSSVQSSSVCSQPPIPEKCLHRLTFLGRFDTAETEDIDAEKDQKELEKGSTKWLQKLATWRRASQYIRLPYNGSVGREDGGRDRVDRGATEGPGAQAENPSTNPRTRRL